LLSAYVIYLIARLGRIVSGADARKQNGVFDVGCGIVASILGLVAALCAIIGIVRFIEWAWYS